MPPFFSIKCWNHFYGFFNDTNYSMFSLYNNKRHFYTVKYTTNSLKISFLEVSVKKVLSLYLTFPSGLYVLDKLGLKI